MTQPKPLILACPFCGDDAESYKTAGINWARPSCDCCGDKAFTLFAWNMRAPTTQAHDDEVRAEVWEEVAVRTKEARACPPTTRYDEGYHDANQALENLARVKVLSICARQREEGKPCPDCQEPESVHGIGGYYCKYYEKPQPTPPKSEPHHPFCAKEDGHEGNCGSGKPESAGEGS